MILFKKIKRKRIIKLSAKIGAIAGGGVVATVAGAGVGGLIYFGVAGAATAGAAAAGAAGTAGAITAGEIATGIAIVAGTGSAAGVAGTTGSIFIAKSIEILQSSDPYKFGFITLFSKLTQIYSGSYLINNNEHSSYCQDSSERDDTQTLKIEEFKDKNILINERLSL